LLKSVPGASRGRQFFTTADTILPNGFFGFVVSERTINDLAQKLGAKKKLDTGFRVFTITRLFPLDGPSSTAGNPIRMPALAIRHRSAGIPMSAQLRRGLRMGPTTCAHRRTSRIARQLSPVADCRRRRTL
jgi:hypothetical protein